MSTASRTGPTPDARATPEVAFGRRAALVATLLFFTGVATVPFMQPLTLKLLGSAVQPSDAVFALTGVVWLVALLSGGIRLRRGRFYVFLGLYLGASLITTAVAPTRSAGRLVIELYLLGLGFLAYNLVRDLDGLRRTLVVWTGTATFTAVCILVSCLLFYAIGLKDTAKNLILWKAGSLPVGNYPRVRGFFINGNMTGNYLAESACLAFGLAALSEKHRRFAFYAGLAISAAALPTLSTALGGLAIAIGLFAWLLHVRTQKLKLLKALLPLAAVFATLLLLFTAGYPKRTDAGIVVESSPRWLTWNSSWGSFLKHPLFGNGLGVELADVYYDAPRGVHEHLTDPHNAWLSISGQMGLVGLAAFLALLIWLARGARPLAVIGDGKSMIRTALFGVWIVVVYQAFSCSLEDMRHVWLAIGLFAGLIESEPEPGAGAIAKVIEADTAPPEGDTKAAAAPEG